MAHMIDSWTAFLKRAGYEARQNAPMAVIVLTMVAAALLGQMDLKLRDYEFIKYLMPGAVFLVASVVALFAHLQSVSQKSQQELFSGRADSEKASAFPQVHLSPIERVAGKDDGPDRKGETSITAEYVKQFHVRQIRAMADGMVNRLRGEIYRLGSRANLNLAVGVVVCLAGFAVLGYYVFFEKHLIDTAQEALQFAVRFCLVLFIEVFAYFFLNLYRGGLLDIKYFQNEITNATFRLMALEAAFVKADTATIKRLCEDMSKTERNIVLKKGDVPYDLRQTELLMEQERSMVSTLERLINLRSSTTGGGGQGKRQHNGRARSSRGKSAGRLDKAPSET